MLRIRFFIPLCMVFLAFSIGRHSVLAVGDAWPMYGHDSAHTARSASNGPNTANLKWSYTADGVISDPVVASDGTIYFTVWRTYNDTSIVALNSNGSLKWQQPSSGTEYRYPTIGTNGNVYVVSVTSPGGAGFLVALDPAHGTQLWDFDIGDSSVIGTDYSHPTLSADGTIYLASALGKAGYGTVFAVNPDGSQKWAWDTNQISCGTPNLIYCSIESSPALAPNGNIMFKSYSMGIITLNSSTGAFVWNIDPDMGDPFDQTFSIGADNVAFTTEGYGRYNFLAVNPNGTVKWTQVLDNWNDYAMSALSADGTALFRGDNGGIFYSLDTADGTVRWQFASGIEGTNFSGAPVLSANGILYFTISSSTGTPAGSHGYLYALRADSGEVVWQYEVGFTGANLAMGADGTLYVPGDRPDQLGTGNIEMLYAFQCADGTCAIPPHDTVHTVTNLNDSGAGSLRQAVADSFYGDTIQFQPGLTGTIMLASSIVLDVRVTINGPTTGTITLDGGDSHPVLTVSPGRGLNINHLTIANGKPGLIGGGIVNINNMVFTSNDNPSGNGGAINVGDAVISIDHSTFTNNKGYYGGGIYNSGIATISSSTFTSNQATTFDGGAIFNSYSISIDSSTFTGNSSSFGGALSNNGSMQISNSTFTGNSGTFGGALMNSGAVTIVNSTIAQNYGTVGAGLYDSGSGVTLKNTILANNGSANCDRTVANGGGNLQYPGTDCGAAIPVGNPLLAALANNGGSTQTMALQTGSPAIDAGDDTICAASPVNNLDQRGIIRPVNGDGIGSAQCDIGSFEAGGTLPVQPTLSPPNAAPLRNYYTTATPVLTWNRVSWATGYEIQVDTDNMFTAPYAFHNDTLPPNQFNVPTSSLSEGTYYWHVRAKKPDGTWGAWSATESFLVDIP